MTLLRGFHWGPDALPDFLRAQLDAHGFAPDDAGRCARLINEHQGGAAAGSLFVDLGSCKFLEADIDGAIAAWRHAIASPHDAAAARSMLNLGLLFEHLHLHEQALGMLARVAERDIEPYVVAAAMASARSQVALGQSDVAMETMARLAQKVMADRPDDGDLVEALYGLGDVAEHAGRSDRAERAWRAAAASPTSSLQRQAATRLVQLLLSQGQSHAVDTSATGCQPDSPHDLPAILDTAELFLRTGEKQLAAQLLSTIDSRDFAAADRFRYVDANLMAGRINEAIDELEVLLATDDEQTQNRALVSLGRVYASYDMIDPAVSMLQRAVASDDPYWMPAASLALGDVLAARGDRGPAVEYWSYAAGGAVPRLAELAKQRTANLESAAPDPAAPVEIVLVDSVKEADQSSHDLPDLDVADLDVADLDQLDPNLLDLEMPDLEMPDLEMPDLESPDFDQPLTLVADLVEPQVILLDTLDADTAGSANGDDASTVVPDTVAARTEAEAVVMVLADLEDDAADDVVIDLNRDDVSHGTNSEPASAFADYSGDDVVSNPYAVLAPDGHASDVSPTTRNPYAELAPNFASTDFEPPPDVEPGDWESMLGDAVIDERPPKKRPSAFSRYT